MIREISAGIIKKYDRSFVAILTAIGLAITAYLSIGNKLDSLIANSPSVKSLENKVDLNEKMQQQTNGFMSEKFMEINRKLDYLVRK